MWLDTQSAQIICLQKARLHGRSKVEFEVCHAWPDSHWATSWFVSAYCSEGCILTWHEASNIIEVVGMVLYLHWFCRQPVHGNRLHGQTGEFYWILSLWKPPGMYVSHWFTHNPCHLFPSFLHSSRSSALNMESCSCRMLQLTTLHSITSQKTIIEYVFVSFVCVFVAEFLCLLNSLTWGHIPRLLYFLLLRTCHHLLWWAFLTIKLCNWVT